MRYGHCRRATLIFRRDGPSSSAVSQRELRRVKVAPPLGLPKESVGFGSGGFGNTRFEMRRILRDMWIMSISTRSSMDLSAALAIGRFHRSGARLPLGIIRPIGGVERRYLESSAKGRRDETASKGWGAEEHPTLRWLVCAKGGHSRATGPCPKPDIACGAKFKNSAHQRKLLAAACGFFSCSVRLARQAMRGSS